MTLGSEHNEHLNRSDVNYFAALSIESPCYCVEVKPGKQLNL